MSIHHHLAKRADVLAWADRINARSQLPEIVRRLIRETNDQILSLDMPSDEGVARHGFDGIVRAGRGTPFVPEGLSVWEMGTDKDARRKAEKEYAGRTHDPLGVDRGTTTFCFVTPRQFPNKRLWQDERRAESIWKDVRVFDVDDLCAELASAPATHYRLSELLDLPAGGAKSLATWWERFARQSAPGLTPELVLTDRADASAELLIILDRDTSHTVVNGASVDDVLAFVASTLIAAEATVGRPLLDKALVVFDTAALRHLDSIGSLLILLPFEEDLYREARLLANHHVIYLAEGNVPSDIGLKPLDPRKFAAGLERAGVPPERAQALGDAANRSLVAFQRQAPAVGEIRHPNWSDQLASASRRRVWLAGAWNASRSADCEVLAALTGTDYERLEEDLAAILQDPDPVMTRTGQTWSVVDRRDSWQYAVPKLTSPDLDRLEGAIQTVLGAIDPSLQLPIDERWTADIRGLSRIHSSDLRASLASCLAILGTRGRIVQLGNGRTAEQWVDGIMFSLLNRANQDTSLMLWTSLADLLPVLAEASPSVLLRALSEGLDGDEPLLGGIFTDKEDAGSSFLTGSSPHSSFQWALETLAWSPEHVGLAVEILARLAELDPGGRLSNRPLASLNDIFRPWGPQTSASLEEREMLTAGLVERHPAIAWKVLLSIVPEPHAVGMYGRAPEYRDWPATRDEKVTFGEIWRQGDDAVTKLLTLVADRPNQWPELLERVDDMTDTQRGRVLDALESTEALDDASRLTAWSTITKMLRRHEAFPDAKWSFGPGPLEGLKQAAMRLQPASPIDTHRWLFDDAMPDVPDRHGMAFEDLEAEVQRLRAEALSQIVEAGGFDALQSLATEVEYPGTVGATAAHMAMRLDHMMAALLDSSTTSLVTLSMAYFQNVSLDSEDHLRAFAQTGAASPLAKARLLLCLPPGHGLWEGLADFGQEVTDLYWAEFRPWGLGSGFPYANEAARELLRVARPAAALQLLTLYRKSESLDHSLIVSGLRNVLTAGPDAIQQIREYDLEELLSTLRESDIDRAIVAELEWQWLPLLGFDTPSPTLELEMASSPQFFMEVLSLAFRAEGDDSDPDEQSRAMANHAFRLLREFKTVPGSPGRGAPIDESQLSSWMQEVRSIAKATDRVAIAEVYMGHVLAHSGQDTDGTWPSRSVRSVIEASASPRLENGFSVETFNKRGVTSRSLDEGGVQEYELAARFRAWAESVRPTAPRTGAVLTALADGYERDGRAEDERTELRRKGLGW